MRAWAAGRVEGPWYTPDETVYAELGRSLYRVGRFEVLGQSPEFFGAVYPALVGLPLTLADVERGYAVLKPLQALVMSLAAVPIYLWGRTLVSGPLALTAAALTLCLPVFVLAGFVMTEVAFLPVFCLTAFALARAIASPTPARQALALAAVALAVLTRLQAVALLAAYPLAIVLEALCARGGLERVRRFALSLGVVAACSITALLVGRKALGAYAVTATGGYDLGGVARFVGYHVGALVVAVGVVPAVAFVAASAPCFAGKERDRDVRAFVAVTLAVAVVLLVEVGAFASRFSGRLAERNLVVVAPLLFLGLALWLERGAPRGRLFAGAAAAAIAVVAVVPWNRLATRAAEPDAPTLTAFAELHERWGELSPRVTIAACALALVALAAVPRRIIVLVPLGIALALAAASIAADRRAVEQAAVYRGVMVGQEARWIDAAAAGPVVFLDGGELAWSGGGPLWTNLFWNERIEEVWQLFGAREAGPAPRHPMRVAGSGRVGRGAGPSYAVAASRLTLAGQPIASSSAALVLWRVAAPLRITVRKDGVHPASGALAPHAQLTIYACRGGTATVTLRSRLRAVVVVGTTGSRAVRLPLAAGEERTFSRALRPAGVPGASPCVLSLDGAAGVRATRLDFAATR